MPMATPAAVNVLPSILISANSMPDGSSLRQATVLLVLVLRSLICSFLRAAGPARLVDDRPAEAAMTSVGGQHVEEAVEEMVAVLMPHGGRRLAGSGWLARVELLDDRCSCRPRLGFVRGTGRGARHRWIPPVRPRDRARSFASGGSGGGLRVRSTPEHHGRPRRELGPLRGTGGCRTRRGSRRWASQKRSCTPTTSRRVWGWRGLRRNRCVSWSLLGSFPMHHPGARRRSCSGQRVERISKATLTSASGCGEPTSDPFWGGYQRPSAVCRSRTCSWV